MIPTTYKVVMVSSGNLLDLVRKNKNKINSTTPISQEEEVDSEDEE